MPIKTYIHGDGRDYQLWGNVGRLIVDIDVHKKLGTAVSSKIKDIWWVKMTEKSYTTGFASARPMRNGHLHLRHVYSVDDSLLEMKTLISKAIHYAQDQGYKMIYTNQPRDMTLLAEMGFNPVPRDKGRYIRWELMIKETL